MAHNLDFDRGFLERWAGRLKLPWLASRASLDTVTLGRILVPGLSGHRLKDLSRFFELDQGSAHRALDDARVAGELLLKLLRLAIGLDLSLLRALCTLIRDTDDPAEIIFTQLLEQVKQEGAVGDWASQQPVSRSHVYQREGDADSYKRPRWAEWFGEGGRLSQGLEDFRPRSQQLEMAEAVWQTLCDSPVVGGPATLSVEAATGTGKSFAYLLPALIKGIEGSEKHEGPVLVSTYTRNLQDQLFEKDIPLLGRLLEQPVKAVLLKGRGNYLCEHRLNQLIDEAPRRLSARERIELMPLVSWARVTRNGDVEECGGFRARYNQGIWQAVRSESSTCRNPGCRESHPTKGAVCWAAHSRRESQDAQLLVINHSLLLSDIGVDHGVLGDYSSLILDEAHHLVKAAEQQLKRSFSPQLLEIRLRQIYDPAAKGRGHLKRLLDLIGGRTEASGELFSELEEAARLCRDAIEPVSQLRQGLNQLLLDRHREDLARRRFTQKCRIREENHPLRQLVSQSESGKNSLASLLKQLARFCELWRKNWPEPDRVGELEALVDHLAQDLEELGLLLDESWGSSSVVWTELHPGTEEGSFHRVELNVGEQLSTSCWMALKHLVLCSATLRVDDSFDFLHHRLGLDLLPAKPRGEVYESPFDFGKQARFFVPAWLPESSGWSQRDFARELALLLEGLSERYGRGTLVLFTSYGLLNVCYEALLEELDTRRTPVFGQGLDGNRHELLERFRQEPGAILLGTDSFWQGVDLPGETLQLLVMTKLPFDVPGEPLIEARGEQVKLEGGHPFGDLAVPEAVIRFRQGFGRLIRHEDDRGAFLLLDRRVIDKSYGRRFLDALPLEHTGVFKLEDLYKRMDKVFRRTDGGR